MPYRSSGDIADTFGLVDFVSVAMFTTVGRSAGFIRPFERVDLTLLTGVTRLVALAREVS